MGLDRLADKKNYMSDPCCPFNMYREEYSIQYIMDGSIFAVPVKYPNDAENKLNDDNSSSNNPEGTAI